MTLPPFRLLHPATLKEALLLMSSYGDKLRVLAGGTEITGRLKQRLLTPSHIMSLKKLQGFTGIDQKRNELRIRAGTMLSVIAASEAVRSGAESLGEAAKCVGAPAIRNVATIGGNLLQESRCLYYNQSQLARDGLNPCYKRGGATCHAARGLRRCFSVYQGDLAPVLVALEARANVQRKGDSRMVRVEELFTGNGAKPIGVAPDELLTDIIIPIPHGRAASAYRRVAMRGSIDYPLASAAAFIHEGKNRVMEEARIVLGAAGSKPKIAVDAAHPFLGRRARDIKEPDLEQSARLAGKAMEAVDNLVLPASYRRSVATVMVKRALEEALRRLEKV